MTRFILVLAAVLLLAGCSAAPPRAVLPQDRVLAAQAQREAALAQRMYWRLSGRIAVSDGQDGGSGRLEWVQDGDRYEITLNAPVTRRSWRLVGEPDSARLEGLDGGPFTDASAERLLSDHLGWHVPLGDLVAWVQGARARGPAQIEFQPSGVPALIEQNGWRIEYRSFELAGEPPMPLRVFATRGQQRVRLQVDAWAFSTGQ
ncbi:lipoprotein insertase outer membrane protein LolB [Xanthomonadaceae bacterium JHOS43]|nr:lipoprotein insertase outer membrane protein LolB [Xanthomonadaceae bacterium JHOS43]MCX7563153.1 lipoprotein insertase outer membrane protein LolB [Xanthomonadaceae bacterium XH05]